MKVDYCEQGSPEWFAVRAGKVTSSVIDDVMRKKADAVTREKLKYRIVGELLGGKSEDGYVSKYMQDGKDKEPLARTAYELANNVMLERVGFVYHPEIELAGCSPDSLIGDDGVLELKAPKLETHMQYMDKNQIPPEYQRQCIWHLCCTRREWLDFVSFYPGLGECELFVKRMELDIEVREMFEDSVRQFLAEVEDMRLKFSSRVRVTA